MPVRFVITKNTPMERIKTAYGNFTAYVNRIGAGEEDLYHISFVDNRNKVHIAVLAESVGGWSFVNAEALPDSIVELHSQFEMLIARDSLRHHLPIIAKAV
jgi:hypothetical protein